MSRRVFDVLVYFLGLSLILCIAGVIFLLATDNPVDDILKQTITGLVTGLLGLMVRAPASPDDDPQPVHVVNAGIAEAVPVAEAPALPARKSAKKR